ncbi:MAG: hypothetical protein ACOC9P_01260 [bacterium]
MRLHAIGTIRLFHRLILVAGVVMATALAAAPAAAQDDLSELTETADQFEQHAEANRAEAERLERQAEQAREEAETIREEGAEYGDLADDLADKLDARADRLERRAALHRALAEQYGTLADTLRTQRKQELAERQEKNLRDAIDESDSMTPEAKEKAKDLLDQFLGSAEDESDPFERPDDFEPELRGEYVIPAQTNNQHEAAAAPARDDWFYIAASGGGGPAQVDLPRVDVGTAGSGGDERALNRSDARLSGYYLNFMLTYDSPPNGGGLFGNTSPALNRWVDRWAPDSNWTGALGLRYMRADGDRFAELAPGGRDFAMTYEREAPNGSTGLNFGDGGATSEIDSEYEQLSIFSRLYLEDLARFNNNQTRVRVGVGLRGDIAATDHDGWTRSTAFPDSMMMANYDLDSFNVGPELGARLTHHVGDTGLSLFAGGSVFPHYYHHDLDYTQTTDVPVAPADEQNLRFKRDDRDDGFGFGAGLEVGFDYVLTDNVHFNLTGSYEWTDSAGEIDTKISPNDSPTSVGTDDQEQVAVTAGLGIQF